MAKAQTKKPTAEEVTQDKIKVLRNDMLRSARRLLMDQPIIKITEFERIITEENQKAIDAIKWDKVKISGRDRTRAENLTDWVKADLTSDGRIHYLTAAKTRYIVANVRKATYNGVTLVDDQQFAHLIDGLCSLHEDCVWQSIAD